MIKSYELIVKGTRNFENKVSVIVALQDKERFAGEIVDLNISMDRVEGATLEFYETEAIKQAKILFRDIAAGLCEGNEPLPGKRPIMLSPAVWQLPAPALPVGTGGGAAGNPPCRRRKLDGPGISQRSDSSCADRKSVV